MKTSIAKLDIDMVNICRRRLGLKPKDLAAALGYKQAQGYYWMMQERSIAKVPQLAQIFGVEKRALVVIE